MLLEKLMNRVNFLKFFTTGEMPLKVFHGEFRMTYFQNILNQCSGRILFSNQNINSKFYGYDSCMYEPYRHL